MNVGPVTARYTDAIFDLAHEKGVLDEVRRDVEQLAAEVADEKVEAFLLDARIATSEKRQRVAQLTQSFNPLTQNLVSLLFDKNREQVLIGIGAAFRAKVLASRGAVEGVVESARPLGSGELAELAVAIGAQLKKEVLLENRLVPDLVGGVRVLVEGRLIDYSVQGRLASLRRKMEGARLPQMSGN